MFKDISYLKNGNKKQKKSYEILKEIKIFEILENFNPILVGTIPISIDIDSSDLDIVCYVKDFNLFEKLILNHFFNFQNFSINREKLSQNILVINFFYKNIEIEIFASNTPSEKTNGYRHMIIESKILSLANEKFKNEIITLKRKGVKTEPAFSKLLNLSGNPYDSLLEFESFSEEKISLILSKLNW